MAPRHCVHKFRQSLAVGHHHFRASTAPTEDERSDSTGIAEPVPSNDGCASKARWIDSPPASAVAEIHQAEGR
jgi:hypothetical protein